ncbi:uncharacterized protein [Chironomus tepperi]|uniref:uncharacterized protein n=1 Tax=Chironomus tepperi TaxID=113505 RepID=UPI00391FA80C
MTQFESLKSQMDILKICMYSMFGLFVALKLMIICKWCSGTRSARHIKPQHEEIEMTSAIKSNETSVRYRNIDSDSTKAGSIGGRQYSSQFQNSACGTLPKTTNVNYSNIHKPASHYESQIYDKPEFDDSNVNPQQQLNDFNYPPPPDDVIYSNTEDIYYDEFNDGLTDDIDVIYDNVDCEPAVYRNFM